MAKTLYVPVNNLSSEVKKILVPVGGVSKYAVKGYCSVNGLSKQFWGASQPTGKVIFENGEFTNITSPSCQRKTITYAGDENTPSAQSNGVIINKDIGWLREYSQTASYPWTITNGQIVSGNISSISGVSDDSENILAIPVLGSIIENSGSGSAIAAKIRITLKATGSNGPFVVGTNYAKYSGTYYYYPFSQIQRVIFGSNPSSTQYPLNQVVTVDLDLSNDRLNYLKNNLHDGYWWVCIGSPPNYGYTPKVYIDKIEYIDLN